MDQALRNLVGMGLAAGRSFTPHGQHWPPTTWAWRDRGRLQRGPGRTWWCWTAQLQVQPVWVEGARSP
jgi:hypothetical protein